MEQRAWTQLPGGGHSSVKNGARGVVCSTGAPIFHTAAFGFADGLASRGDIQTSFPKPLNSSDSTIPEQARLLPGPC